MSITASHMSRDMRCSVPSRVMPALFTRISIGPTSSVSCRTASWHSSKWLTSNFATRMPVSSWNAAAALSFPA